MSCTIFDAATGQIKRVVTAPVGMVSLQLQGTEEDWIDGHWPDDQYYVENYVAVPIPERPSVNHVFEYSTKQWVDPRSLDDLKTLKRTYVNNERSAFEFGGFLWGTYFFDSDAISQQRIQGAVQMSLVAQSMNQPFSIDWTLADNSVIALSGSEMVLVGLTMGQHISYAHAKARLLKQEIDAATSSEELDLIVW